jgi:hypothetical protein
LGAILKVGLSFQHPTIVTSFIPSIQWSLRK